MGGYYPPRRSRTSRGSHERMLELILRQGDISAQSRMQGADILSSLVGNLGQQGAAAIEASGKEKALKRQAAEMGRRDAAWVQYVESGEWQKSPDQAYVTARRIFGPDGDKQFMALQGVAQLMGEKRNPEADQKALGSIVGAMDAVQDPARARLWPQAVSLARRVYPDVQIPDEYDPAAWPEVSAIGKSLRGEKAPEPKRYMVTTPGPGGRPMARLASEEELEAGVPVYRELKEPKAPEAEPLMAVIGDDGQPVYMPRSQAVGRRPASIRETGRQVTAGDAGRIAELDTSLDDLAVLGDTLAGSKATGAAARAGAMLWNPITEATGIGTEAKQKQATIDRVKQVIGKALEGGVLRKEDELKYEKILPTIGDPPDVVKTKLEGLAKAIRQRRERELDAREDAGYDVSKFRERSSKKKGAADPLGLRGGGGGDPLGLR